MLSNLTDISESANLFRFTNDPPAAVPGRFEPSLRASSPACPGDLDRVAPPCRIIEVAGTSPATTALGHASI
jgi:hypothetical protein